MTTLHDRLTTLAERVDDGIRPSADELWIAGRRLHRRRRAGTVAIVGACVIALLGLGLLDHHRSSVQPASGRSGLAIPDHIHEPSKWLPGTNGEPWDRLIAVIPAERGGWFGTEGGWVGVSAETGEYRFLDLRDIAGDQDLIALSPDGRYVAYWITGTVSEPPPDTAPTTVVGYAVYDVGLGSTVVRARIDSDKGLMVEQLLWVDERTLLASFSQRKGAGVEVGSVGVDGRTRSHDVLSDTATRWPGEPWATAGHGWAVQHSSETVDRLRSERSPGQPVRLRGKSAIPPVADASGSRFATLQPRNPESDRLIPNPIATARLTAGRTDATYEPVPGRQRYADLLGWKDKRTVLALRRMVETDPSQDEYIGVYAVDIRTGDEARVGVIDGVLENSVQFATDLVALPATDRPAPPTPLSQWGKVGIVALLLALGGWSLLAWRRRVGP